MRFMGFCWLLTGAVWLRRSYVGERGSIQQIMTPSLDRIMSQRDRFSALVLGVIQAVMGLAALIVAQK